MASPSHVNSIGISFKMVRDQLELMVRQGQARRGNARALVEKILTFDVPLTGRYKHINVVQILQENSGRSEHGLEELIRALSILEKYGKNLLRTERPPQWRVVRLSNSIFKNEVDIVVGARTILKLLGYSKSVPDGLSYPDECLIPDVPIVASVTTDILVLRTELLMLGNNDHPRSNNFHSYISTFEIMKLQMHFGMNSMENSTSGLGHLPENNRADRQVTPQFPKPPSYNDVKRGAGQLVNIPHEPPPPPPEPLRQNFMQPSASNHVYETPIFDGENENFEGMCDMCGERAEIKCLRCEDKPLCLSCSQILHRHPKRRNHEQYCVAIPQLSNFDKTLPILDPPLPKMDDPLFKNSYETLNGLFTPLGGDDLTAKASRMAVDLLGISNPDLKIKKLKKCHEEIDAEAAKYRDAIKSASGKPELIQYFNDKLDEIGIHKKELAALCGYNELLETSYPSSSDPSSTSHIYEEISDPPLINLNDVITSPLASSSNDQSSALSPQQSGAKRSPDDEVEPKSHAAKVPKSIDETDVKQALNQKMLNQFRQMNIDSPFIKQFTGDTPGIGQFESFNNAFLNEFGSLVDHQGAIVTESPFSVLSTEELQNKMKKEKTRCQSVQFLDLIRAGDVSSFRPELIDVAMNELEKQNHLDLYTPNAWIERNWPDHVQSFIQLAKTEGFKMDFRDAEDVLIEADGVFNDALELIKSAQLDELQELIEPYGLPEVKKALGRSKRDKYIALSLLQKSEVDEIYADILDFDDERTSVKKALNSHNDSIRINGLASLLQFKENHRAETFYALLQTMPPDLHDTLLEDAVESIADDTTITDVQAALRYLDNECMICTEKFPRSKITCLPTCGDNGCQYCVSCLQQHLTICIRDKNIRDIVCPVCSNPELSSDEETRTHFFNHIDAVLRTMPDNTVHEIFQQKMRDFTLMRLPNFRWCSHCSGGFQFDVVQNNIKMQCPFCHMETCYLCKKQWEPQHDNTTCEQFQKWKEENDPEYQAAGLARHLRENGIDCPDCHFRYALAKGGCMHFKCTQCSHEFCSGCSQGFKHGRQCGKFPSCVSKGLHAHHPRDCLFYLRDLDPNMLIKLLKDNSIAFDVKGGNQQACEVMEQKETPTGLKDMPCGRAIERNCAGLCKLHYMEYLVNLVNMHHLDPADAYDADQLRICLLREEVNVPQKRARESEQAYRAKLLAKVKELPLTNNVER